jgi:hypothetical protein
MPVRSSIFEGNHVALALTATKAETRLIRVDCECEKSETVKFVSSGVD